MNSPGSRIAALFLLAEESLPAGGLSNDSNKYPTIDPIDSLGKEWGRFKYQREPAFKEVGQKVKKIAIQ
jgi:hypothetical protein